MYSERTQPPEGQGVPVSPGDASGAAPDAPGHGELRQLFEAHNGELVGFLRGWLGNDPEAREVAQEAYVRLLQLDRPESISFLRAYLYRLAKNIAIDRLRHRDHVASHALSQAGETQTNELSPEREYAGREALAIVRQALEELPAGYRRAFLLRRFSDATTAQIGRELGLSETQVYRYLRRTATYCRLRMQGRSAAAARKEVFK